MIYEALVLIGGVGLAAQALLGFAHFGGAHTGHHLSGGDLHGHAHVHLHIGDSTPTGNGGQHHLNAAENSGASAHTGVSLGKQAVDTLWALFSPLTLFSLSLGGGVAGLAATAYVRNGALVAVLAVLGALAFYGFVVRPMWRFVFAFASKPAKTLSGAVAGEAEAVSRFDARGRGIVNLPIDGQIVRLLAHLDPDSHNTEIVPGDRLLVTAVDNHSSTCTVTKI